MEYGPDLVGAGVKTFATLCVVLGLLILVLYLAKRFFMNRNSANSDTMFKTLSSYYLAPKARIMLIEVMGEKLVIGVSQDNIRFLKKIECAGEGPKENRETEGFLHE